MTISKPTGTMMHIGESGFEVASDDLLDLCAVPDDAVCFYCLQSVYHPVVMWMSLEPIWLHRKCAQRFAARLLDDADRLESLDDQPNPRDEQ